jgi:hypothetical protein
MVWQPFYFSQTNFRIVNLKSINLKRSVFVILLALAEVTAFSQVQPALKGRVLSKEDNKPVELAAVVIKELNIWASTDENGSYVIKSVPNGKYTLVVTCLGYVQNEQPVIFPVPGGVLDILIEQNTLALDEVVVVAREGKKMGSESMIQQAALQHVQPTDLSDVLQLLPGQIATNPDLSKTKQLSIREITNQANVSSIDNMSSLGTAIIIDGANMSNDANMQFLSTATATTGLTAGFSTSASGGADVRQIPVDNIESIEVVRGVGSVENGDMLSGAIKVTMKKGKTPFNAKIKIDPGIKEFYAGKGFSLGKKSGTLNTDIDITRSLDDLRDEYKTFNRFNFGLSWSNTFLRDTKPLTLNISLRGNQTIDQKKTDPDLLDMERYETTEKGLSMNINGKWALNSKLLTNLNFMLAGNAQHQIGREIDFENNSAGISPQPISLISGEFEVPILPSTYISDLTIDGRPYYLESKLSGNKSFYLGRVLNNVSAGAEWKVNGNNGNGRQYDLSRPPSATSNMTARPRSYKDIPAVNQLSLYAEENITIPVDKSKLDIQAGLRFSNLQPDGIFSSRKDILMLDPRTNIRFTVFDDNRRTFQNLVLRLGYGLFSKAPTLPYLYPDKGYWDKVAFNYYDSDAADGLVVVQTAVYDNTSNNNLKAALNTKVEGGFDLKIDNISFNVTVFSEKMKNGFSFKRSYHNMVYNKYDGITAEGTNPYYVQGDGVYYTNPVTGDITKLSSVKDTVFTYYTMPSNNGISDKKGVEFTIDFGEVKQLKTSFIIDGSYMNIRKQDMEDYWIKPDNSSSTGSKEYPYIALYPGGSGSIYKRFCTNLRTITHIKELRMVASATLQVVWFSSSQQIYEDSKGNPLVYTKAGDGNPYTDLSGAKYLNPLGYIDHSMTYHTFDPAMATTTSYKNLIDTYNLWFFLEKKYPPFYQINFKLTKEITDFAEFSFYANNITDYRPLVKVSGTPNTYQRMNSVLYFGAELKIKF